MDGPKGNMHIVPGVETVPFRKDALKDLVTVQPRPELDTITRIVAENFLPWLSRKLLYRIKVWMQLPAIRHTC